MVALGWKWTTVNDRNVLRIVTFSSFFSIT